MGSEGEEGEKQAINNKRKGVYTREVEGKKKEGEMPKVPRQYSMFNGSG